MNNAANGEILRLTSLAERWTHKYAMKKFLAIALIFGVYQNWDVISDFVTGAPRYEPASDGVVLYATQWCRYCEKTRKLFAKNNIPYVEFDIEKSEQGRREYRKLSGRGVPVVNAYGTIIHGYSRQLILDAVRSNNTK